MLTRRTLPCTVIVVAAGLIAATAARATDSLTCTPLAVQVLAGPCPVSNPTSPACTSQGGFTGIQYKLNTTVDYVATLVTANNSVSIGTQNQVFDACKGDPVTGLGEFSCHEKAVKVKVVNQKFWVVVEGSQQSIKTSVVAKKGSKILCSAIAGLGLQLDAPEGCVSSCGNFDPDQTIKKTEVLKFKDCSVQFEFDTTTGAVTNALLTEDSDPACDFHTANVEGLEITLDGVGSLGTGKFGDGIIASGSQSCTTRVIGGKVYTWGKPCP